MPLGYHFFAFQSYPLPTSEIFIRKIVQYIAANEKALIERLREAVEVGLGD